MAQCLIEIKALGLTNCDSERMLPVQIDDLRWANPIATLPPSLFRWDRQGPRYTSYPTADRFSSDYSAEDFSRALQLRHSSPPNSPGLSLYVHLPFCDSVCYYCACNKIVTRHHEQAAEYLDYLAREIELVSQHAEEWPSISQLHLGGGTPTFFSDAQLAQLMRLIRAYFHVLPEAECSIEIDPRTVTHARLAHLHAIGFNRLSLGVQDFNTEVQKAVHREQSFDQVAALMVSARTLGYKSVSLDLIYGLPLQSLPSIQKTLDQVIILRPDRIALYGYAHLPERFKPQRRIHTEQLPDVSLKAQMLALARQELAQAGYMYIGMDHFALPQDELAIAKQQGALHRNFQGYSTQPDCDLIGLGVSAISKIGKHYSQNVKNLSEYYESLRQDKIPVERGLVLTRDDELRYAVIMALMCQGWLSYTSINQTHRIDFKSYFAQELEQLLPLKDDGLVQIHFDGIQVTHLGWYAVRAVAMLFDKHLQQANQPKAVAGYSKVI
jgi:oxygen-independent coproporphyrinogen III oxidase